MPDSASDKVRYRNLCKSSPTIPIFSQDWWLDAVCGAECWDVALAERGGEIVGSLPYFMRKRYGTVAIEMPPLTMTMGPWIRYPVSQKHHNRISLENDVMTELIDSLPPHGYFNQRFHRSLTNWLPFYWKGYSQNTRYTYILGDLTDLDAIYKGFENSARGDIAKAQNVARVEVSDDIDEFYRINMFPFKKQNIKVPYSLGFIRRLDKACEQRGRRRILVSRRADGEATAGLYFVWDDVTTYPLMSGVNTEIKRNSDAKWLTWESIKFAHGVSKVYDFEGSMLQPIEKYNRTFGAVQMPYMNISKVNAGHLRLLRGVRDFISL